MSYSWPQYPPQGAYHQPGSNQTGHAQQDPPCVSGTNSLATYSAQVPAQRGVSGAQGQPPTGSYPSYQGQFPPPNNYHQAPYNAFGGWGISNGGHQVQIPYGSHGAHAYLTHGHYSQQPWVSHQVPYGHSSYGSNAYQAQSTYGYKNQHQHKVAQPSLNTCFNCGDPSHWAQDCPKPRQAIPHGQIVQGNKRRLNYIPPVVTKYPVPPHVAAGQPNLHSQSPNSHSGFPMVHAQYGRDAVAAPSPQVSQNSWRRSSSNPSVGISASTPHSMNMSPTAPNQHKQSLESTAAGLPPSYGSQPSSAPSRKASVDQSVSMESNSDAGIDEENLSLLDVPDFPRNHGSIIAKPPVPVRHPLPSISNSDELGRISEPEPTSDGKVQSKYIKKFNEGLSSSSFEELKALEGRREDPLFIRITSRSSAPTSPRFNQNSPSRSISTRELEHDTSPDARSKQAVTIMEAEELLRYEPPTPNEVGNSLSSIPEPFQALNNNGLNNRPRPSREPLQRQASWSFAASSCSPARDPPYHTKRRHSSAAIHSLERSFTDSRPPNDQMQRKRKHEPCDDDQDSVSKRRQYDNITSKPKHDQPKVATAYNRRW